MFFRLLLAFTVMPIVELWVLIEIGRIIGTAPTVGLVIITGFVGAALTKQQGFITLQRLQFEADQGRVAGDPLIDGALILVGGLTLLTPGFVTDIVGFSLLIPATRLLWREFLKRQIQHWVQTGSIRISWWR